MVVPVPLESLDFCVPRQQPTADGGQCLLSFVCVEVRLSADVLLWWFLRLDSLNSWTLPKAIIFSCVGADSWDSNESSPATL